MTLCNRAPGRGLRVLAGDIGGADSIFESMVDKGRTRPPLERMPAYLVRDDYLALAGAASKVLCHAE
jgi:glucokinase